MTNFKVKASSDVVTNTFLVNSMSAYVLFGCRASHSFIARKFAKHLCMHPEWMDNTY